MSNTADLCDGPGPHTRRGVKKLPYGSSGGNLILCYACYRKEIAYRQECNRIHKPRTPDVTPAWDTLEEYPDPCLT